MSNDKEILFTLKMLTEIRYVCEMLMCFRYFFVVFINIRLDSHPTMQHILSTTINERYINRIKRISAQLAGVSVKSEPLGDLPIPFSTLGKTSAKGVEDSSSSRNVSHSDSSSIKPEVSYCFLSNLQNPEAK